MIENLGVLKGSGHFAVGFLVGYLLFLLMIPFVRYSKAALYIPLIPFVLGGIAAFPYLFSLAGIFVSSIVESDLFFFYESLNRNREIIAIFNDLNRVVLGVALLYAGIIYYYIRLIKRFRRSSFERTGREL